MIEMYIAAGRRDVSNLRLQAAGHAVKLAAVDGIGACGSNCARGDVFDLAFKSNITNRHLVTCNDIITTCKTAISNTIYRSRTFPRRIG